VIFFTAKVRHFLFALHNQPDKRIFRANIIPAKEQFHRTVEVINLAMKILQLLFRTIRDDFDIVDLKESPDIFSVGWGE